MTKWQAGRRHGSLASMSLCKYRSSVHFLKLTRTSVKLVSIMYRQILTSIVEEAFWRIIMMSPLWRHPVTWRHGEHAQSIAHTKGKGCYIPLHKCRRGAYLPLLCRDPISLQIPFLAISFPCKFIFPCIFRSLQIPHFAKTDHFLPFAFPCKFISLQYNALRLVHMVGYSIS